MGDDPNNYCGGIKRPSLFITILDFIIALVLIIGIWQVQYTQNAPKIARWERDGRILVSVMLGVRFIQSFAAEYVKSRWMKAYFVDNRDSFKIFSIARYMYFVIIFLPCISLCNIYLEF